MIQEFWKPAVKVEAVQFTGQFGNTLTIFEWLKGCFFVGKGTEDENRKLSELDEKGAVLPDAAPFLIIRTRFGPDRVDVGSWIVKYDEEHISVYTDLDFAYKFNKSSEDGV